MGSNWQAVHERETTILTHPLGLRAQLIARTMLPGVLQCSRRLLVNRLASTLALICTDACRNSRQQLNALGLYEQPVVEVFGFSSAADAPHAAVEDM